MRTFGPMRKHGSTPNTDKTSSPTHTNPTQMNPTPTKTGRHKGISACVRVLAVIAAVVVFAAACSSTPAGDAGGADDSAPASSTPTTVATAAPTVDDSLTVSTPDDTDASTQAQTGPVELTFEGTAPAPEFPDGYDWFNVSRPLSMAGDLRGKIVLLDFWTQGCINCIHIIPDLHRLESEYPDELVVIGVHWAKFDSERTSEAVGEATLRYGRQHPIVNDAQNLLQQAYGVRAWPTVVVIDPNGNVVGPYAGEGVYTVLEPVIEIMAEEFSHNGLIDTTPLGDLLDVAPALPTVLSFPGKVLADEASNRLFIADTGRHRILVATLEGALLDVIGTGAGGRDDGAFSAATFLRPQGMALSADGSTLYVADRENHLIRAANLRTREVSTIAGTGDPVTSFRPGPALDRAIASPWDLHRDGDLLYIAGAGRHQLWLLNLASSELDNFAGSGAEGLDDGYRLAATLSQPSGFAANGSDLYFTDPEASAVRRVSLGDDGELSTLVGEHLFVWGDEVGTFADTRLQHAVGIAYVGGDADGRLYVADTYNHRIKVLDLASETSASVAGDGIAGLRDGLGTQARLAEPSGLSATSQRLYVADTNNHRVRVLDLVTGELSTLALSNLEIAAVTATGVIDDEVVLLPQQIKPGDVEIVLDLELPDGYKFNVEGMFVFGWETDDDTAVVPVGIDEYQARGPTMPVRLRARVDAGSSAVLTATATVFYCPAVDETFCLVRDVNFTVPIEVDPNGASQIALPHRLLSAEELEQRLGSS